MEKCRWKSLCTVCVCVSAQIVSRWLFALTVADGSPPIGTHPTIPLVIQRDESRSLSLFTNACSPDACLSYLLTLILTLHCRDAINCIAFKVKSGSVRFTPNSCHVLSWRWWAGMQQTKHKFRPNLFYLSLSIHSAVRFPPVSPLL